MPKPTLPSATDEERDALAAVSPQDVQAAQLWASKQEKPSVPLKVRDLIEAEEEDDGTPRFP